MSPDTPDDTPADERIEDETERLRVHIANMEEEFAERLKNVQRRVNWRTAMVAGGVCLLVIAVGIAANTTWTLSNWSDYEDLTAYNATMAKKADNLDNRETAVVLGEARLDGRNTTLTVDENQLATDRADLDRSVTENVTLRLANREKSVSENETRLTDWNNTLTKREDALQVGWQRAQDALGTAIDAAHQLFFAEYLASLETDSVAPTTPPTQGGECSATPRTVNLTDGSFTLSSADTCKSVTPPIVPKGWSGKSMRLECVATGGTVAFWKTGDYGHADGGTIGSSSVYVTGIRQGFQFGIDPDEKVTCRVTKG